MNAIVLTAGGSRGAYQAGVLRWIGERARWFDSASPFRIVTGASAGAINGAMLACGAQRIGPATRALAELWEDLEIDDVFRTDVASLARTTANLALGFALGKLSSSTGTQALLDASPLLRLLERHLALPRIGDAIASGALHALAISATSYRSGRSFTFVQGRPEQKLWQRRRRVAVAAEIRLEHIFASASIPIVFAPVRVPMEGTETFFGDGALRLVSPFSPAIRLGAERVFAIGVRCNDTASRLWSAESAIGDDGASRPHPPPLSQICGVFLNAIFLDHLDADLDHLERMNDIVRAGRGGPPTSEPMREIEPLVVYPSEDLAELARLHERRMPYMVRRILEGLGAPDTQSAELSSYMLFDRAYTRALVDLGYRDDAKRGDEIESFLAAPRLQNHFAHAGTA
jgi:NTE family protein